MVREVTFGILLISALWSLACATSCRKTEVLILGAGASGIAAADTLHQQGMEEFLVLEGRDRIGGRVNHMVYKGSKLEIGAAWSHGSYTNHSVWRLLKKHGMHVHEDGLKVMYRDCKTGVQHAHVNVVQTKVEEAVRKMDEIMEERIQMKETEMSLDIGLSLGGWKARTNLEHCVKYWNFDYENAMPASSVSGYHYGMTGKEKEMIVTDKRGYNHIFKATAQAFQNKVLLKKIIKTVKKTKGGYYQVGASDGSCYEGKQVLITFSSNVLASGKVKFDPDLPTWKKRAQLMFPLGHYCKVFLEFAYQFWDSSDHVMAVQRNPEEYSLWQNLNRPGLYPGKNLLVVTLTGDKCLRSQRETDRVVKQDAMRVLKKLYGTWIPNPIGIVRSNWSLDPFSLGAYSYGATGLNDNDWEAISYPVGKMWFAGEHTYKPLFGFLHGAVDSGILAANKILECKKYANKCPKEYKRPPVCSNDNLSCRRDSNEVLPHPTNCSLYIQCHMGKPIVMACPTGTKFNKKTKRCDWPHIARCEE